MIKIKIYIITYKRDNVLNQNLKTLWESVNNIDDIDVTILANYPECLIDDENMRSNLRVIYNTTRMPYAWGYLSRDWNFCILDAFKNWKNPQNIDWCVLAQNDVTWVKDFDLYLKNNLKYDLISQPIGDQCIALNIEAVKKIGFFDERFTTLHYQEADYFLRAISLLEDRCSINDGHFKNTSSLNHNPQENVLTYRTYFGCNDDDTLHNRKNWAASDSFIKAKYSGLNPHMDPQVQLIKSKAFGEINWYPFFWDGYEPIESTFIQEYTPSKHEIDSYSKKMTKERKNIKRIVFIGDLLRCQNGYTGFADRSLGWEYYLLKEQIFQATGIQPVVYYTNNTQKFNIFKFYELCGFELSMENWIKIACGEYSNEAKEYVYECFKDTFVITQVGGALLKVLDDLNIPYIDIYVSAFKFLEDIHLAFRTNIPEVRKKLVNYTFNENHLYIYANYMKSYYWAERNKVNLNIKPNSLLLLGQTDVDLSLIKDNKLVLLSDYIKRIEDLCSKFNKVYYKPHPFAKHNNSNEIFIRSLENIQIIDTNFYKLMLEKNIVAVAALSSGTLTEAKYFGKESYYISHKFVNYCFDKNPTKEDFVLINDEYYSPTFWKDILSPILPTKICDYFNFHNKANICRNSLDISWGYEISTCEMKDLKANVQNITNDMHNLTNDVRTVNELTQSLITRARRPVKFLRRLASLFIPNRKLRRKLRGDRNG